MVIDTSALVAIVFGEPAAGNLAAAIEADPTRLMSAASFVEAAIVVEARKGPVGARELDLALYRSKIDLVPFDAAQAALAREAYQRYGKGRHPAGLNICDCYAYALAAATGEALLFVGEDFPRTDALCVLR